MPAWFDRFSAIPGLLVTSSVCYSLLALQVKEYRTPESFVIWNTNNQIAVTVLVQLFSQILGIVHVHVICALCRSSFLVTIASRPFRVVTAHFIQTLTTPRWSWGMSWKPTIFILAMVAAAVVPAPIWAAALAPVSAERQFDSVITIPSFNVTNITAMWEADPSRPVFGQKEWRTWVTPDQRYYAYISQIFRGALLSSARETSLVVNGQRRHPRLDRTGYDYLGRSYGLGAGAGFANLSDAQAPIWYQYNETGVRGDVSCFYNSSIDLRFEKGVVVPGEPTRWKTYGSVANGSEVRKEEYVAWMNWDLFAWSRALDKTKRRIQLQLITGANQGDDAYSFVPLQKVQCDVGMKMETSTVTVNSTGKTISVIPTSHSNIAWPNYGDHLAATLDEQFNWVTITDNCINYGCTVGQSLVYNLNILRQLRRDNGTRTTLDGTQEFVADLFDNILLNRLLTRYVSGAPQSSQRVPTIIGVPSIVFGDKKFVVIICALNTSVVLAYLVEFVRTRAWKDTPAFDIMNDSEVIVAAFEGGRLYERDTKYAFAAGEDHGRLSERSMLKLQYDGETSDRPVLVLHDMGLEYASIALEEVPMKGISTDGFGSRYPPSFDDRPVEERRLL